MNPDYTEIAGIDLGYICFIPIYSDTEENKVG